MDREAWEVEESHLEDWSQKKAGQLVAGLGKLACKTTSKEPVGQPRRNESRPSRAGWNCAKVYETSEGST